MGKPDNMKAAEGMYASFISTLKWSVPLLAVITLFVVILIS
ncbi:hypothetical protein [Aurantiacibacter marinus]|nr:hypothetical protein [Aurantiacibacter marinus]